MSTEPEVKVQMMIRRPANEVYEYFVEPRKLQEFWLSHASERLEVGKRILWKFKIKGAEDWIEVKVLEPSKRIAILWDKDVEVEWTFTARKPDETMVAIKVSNIKGTAEEKLAYAVDVTEGFAIVLMELKSLLQKGSTLNAIYDKFPDLEHV